MIILGTLLTDADRDYSAKLLRLEARLGPLDPPVTLADAVADRLTEITADPEYVDHAYNMPAELHPRLDAAFLAAIHNDPELLRAYRAVLAPVAEREVREAGNDADDRHQERQYWQNH